MLVPIAICTFLGILLDRALNTSFIVIILFFLGALAGFRNIFIFAKSNDKKKSYLGSDADRKLQSMSGDAKSTHKEDFAELMDRVYKENHE